MMGGPWPTLGIYKPLYVTLIVARVKRGVGVRLTMNINLQWLAQH